MTYISSNYNYGLIASSSPQNSEKCLYIIDPLIVMGEQLPFIIERKYYINKGCNSVRFVVVRSSAVLERIDLSIIQESHSVSLISEAGEPAVAIDMSYDFPENTKTELCVKLKFTMDLHETVTLQAEMNGIKKEATYDPKKDRYPAFGFSMYSLDGSSDQPTCFNIRKKNDRFPAIKNYTVYAPEDGWTCMKLPIYESESTREAYRITNGMRPLFCAYIPMPANITAGTTLLLNFQISENGDLTVCNKANSHDAVTVIYHRALKKKEKDAIYISDPMSFPLLCSAHNDTASRSAMMGTEIMSGEKVIYGIDLGTAYSCLAKMDPLTQKPKVIEDSIDGFVSLPSVVAFPPDEDGVIVGATAKEIAIEYPECVCQFFKRHMGRHDPNKPNYDPDVEVYYNVRGKNYSPVELSAIVLERIKRYAAQCGETLENVIITVPAYFNPDQREATKEAGRLAGLNVLATINEPTAAALTIAHGTLSGNRLMLVYDLGGTFNVTLIRMTSTDRNDCHVEIIATDGNFRLGGSNWDDVMLDILKQKLIEEKGMFYEDEIDPEDLNELRAACEHAKQKLSYSEKSKIRVAGERLEVSREEFNNATASLLQQTLDLMNAMLSRTQKEFGITENQITDVLMVGGSTRMEQVITMLNNRFGEDRVRFNDPEKTVALGAAIAGEMISKHYRLDDLIHPVEQLGLDKDASIKFV